MTPSLKDYPGEKKCIEIVMENWENTIFPSKMLQNGPMELHKRCAHQGGKISSAGAVQENKAQADGIKRKVSLTNRCPKPGRPV